MKTIYIDTLLCVNLFVDFLLLFTLRKVLRINSKLHRILIAAGVASVLTLGVFLPFYTKIFSIFYRIISSIIIIVIAFGTSGIIKVITRTICYIGISIAYSGIISLIWLLFRPDGIVIYNDVVYFTISPNLLIVCTIVAFISITVLEKIKNKNKCNMQIKRVTVISDNGEYSFDSLVDTGCSIKEPFSGLPVIIAEKELVNESELSEENFRIIPFSTISGEGALKSFKPKKIKINGKELENGCYIAICEGKLTGETKSLMGHEIAEGL